MPDYDRLHRQNIESYSRKIRQLYLDVINEVSKLSVGLSLNANDEFYFRNYSDLNNAVNELIKELNSNVRGAIVEGINTSWDIANEKNDAITRELFGAKLAEIPTDIRNKYLSNNFGAKQEFINRKIDGLNLSDRVWNMSTQFKSELELALEYSIGDGKSAAETARQIKGYLNEPNRLYRRVKDVNGVLRLSKNAKAYNPGRGIYRSSYQNALRLSRNENNNSYRIANYEKNQNQDFVVGIEVVTTPGYNSSVDGGGINCGQLAGKYPKNFKFQGWHVNCRCSTRVILKSDAELDSDTERMINGNNPSKTNQSSNYIDGMQPHFNNYVKQNSSLWKNWSNKPYFLGD